jgi:hypothetical protein
METSPDMADKIVKCLCSAQHNYWQRRYRWGTPLGSRNCSKRSWWTWKQFTRANNRCTLRAKRVRDAFTVYFNSDVGRLPESNLW